MELQAERAVIRMTINVTRHATGVTETYELIGAPIIEQDKEHENGSDPSGRGSEHRS